MAKSQHPRRDRLSGLGRIDLSTGKIIKSKESDVKKYSFNLTGLFTKFSEQKFQIYKELSKDLRSKKFLDWCENVFIRTKDYGVMRFSPNVWTYAQWLTISALFNPNYEFVYILKSRQLGITTITLMFDLYSAFTLENLQGIIVGSDYSQIEKPIFLVREIYKSLPQEMRIKKVEDNKMRIRFQNGNYFEYYYPAMRISRMGTMGRGTAVNFAHFTEFAFMANEEDVNAIEASFSSHYENRKYIYESTANGYNFFYERWQANKEIPSTKCLFLGWWSREDYVLTNKKELEFYLDKPVFEWEDEKIKEVKERYKVDISFEQIAWWRKQAIVKYGKDESAVLKEYPFTEDDAFSTSGKQFFYVKGIKDASSIKMPKETYQLRLTGNWTDLYIYKSNFGPLKIWKSWDEKHPYARYIIGVDPAFSTSNISDYSAFVILECYADRVEQIGEFAMNTIDVLNFAYLVLYVSALYDALVNYDVSGGGSAFVQFFQNTFYQIVNNKISITSETQREMFETIKKARLQEYIYRRRDSLVSGQAKGIVFTPEVKKRAILTLNSKLISNELIIRSKSLLTEIENIILHEGEIVARSTATPQDKLMALLCALIAYEDIPKGTLFTYEEAQNKLEELKNKDKKDKIAMQKAEILKTFNEHYIFQVLTSFKNKEKLRQKLRKIYF